MAFVVLVWLTALAQLITRGDIKVFLPPIGELPRALL